VVNQHSLGSHSYPGRVLPVGRNRSTTHAGWVVWSKGFLGCVLSSSCSARVEWITLSFTLQRTSALSPSYSFSSHSRSAKAARL